MKSFQPGIDWTVEYPPGIIKYNDMFRHKFLNYDRLIEHLAPMFKERKIKRVSDFGCGTGTLLFKLEEHGFSCYGFDRHEESIRIAKSIGRRKGAGVKFEVGDMLKSQVCGNFDASIQAFVPISFASQVTTLQSMAKTVRPGGLYSFMVVEALTDCLIEDERTLLHVVEGEDCVVARIEPWKKNGNFIMWEPVLLVQDKGRFSIFIDHDELELYSEQTWQKLFSEVEKLGFSIVDILNLGDSASAPPWTNEKLVTVERLDV